MLIVTLGIALYLYMKQAQPLTTIGSNPQTTVAVTAVRNDLVAIANAERNSFASNGKYISLDELRTGGDITIPTRPDYSYSAELTENSFKIVAAYSGPDPKAPKHITVDQTMAITTE